MGCGATKSTSSKPPEVKPLLEKPIAVHADPGTVEVRSPDNLQEILYKISWQKASLTIGNEGPFASDMEGVSGSMFAGGKEASSFQAESASANKEKQLLKLSGGVDVQSNSYKMKLHCDNLEYRAKQKLIVAKGHLVVSGVNGSLSGPDEIWATPDLKVIATPKEFKRP